MQMHGWLLNMYEMSTLQCAVVRSDTVDWHNVFI